MNSRCWRGDSWGPADTPSASGSHRRRGPGWVSMHTPGKRSTGWLLHGLGWGLVINVGPHGLNTGEDFLLVSSQRYTNSLKISEKPGKQTKQLTGTIIISLIYIYIYNLWQIHVHSFTWCTDEAPMLLKCMVVMMMTTTTTTMMMMTERITTFGWIKLKIAVLQISFGYCAGWTDNT